MIILKKKTNLVLNILLIIFFPILLANKIFANPVEIGLKKTPIAEEIPYTFYDKAIKKTLFMSADEIAIFFDTEKKISKEKMFELSKLFGADSIPSKDSNEFIMFTKIRPDKKFLLYSPDILKHEYPEIKNISPVFYDGDKKNPENKIVPTDEIIIHFHPGWNRTEIDSFISTHNLIYLKKFDFSKNTYLFKSPTSMEGLKIAQEIQNSGKVLYSYPNWFKSMTKKSIPNDTFFKLQWHLYNTGQGGGIPGEDINVINVWDYYKGSDKQIIAIVDDGIETGHEDLSENILSNYQWDWVDNDNNPNPVKSDDNHGTAIAGIIAAQGFNGIGVSGVAPGSKLVGYRLLGATTDVNIALAMIKNKDIISISNNSWGPFDPTFDFPYISLSKPSPLIESSIEEGVNTGRGGKGIIYVFAAGNGGELNDNSNYNGYANLRHTIAVASTTNFGKKSAYSERGSNIFINAPSNFGTMSITTTDRTGSAGYSTSNYTFNFGGTSASTAIVSGVIALILDTNPNLTWRDVQHIILNTATKNDPIDPEWETNNADYNINYKYGFGRINAFSAVELAKNWIPVPEEVIIEIDDTPNIPIPDNDFNGVSSTITIPYNLRIEYVDVFFTSADHLFWGDLEITLKSPSGTESILAEKNSNVIFNLYNNWRFGSIRHFGESSLGPWTLTVKDLASFDVGTFQNWRLKIYGTLYKNHCASSVYLKNNTIYIPVVKLDNNYYWLTLKYEQGDIFRVENYGILDNISLFDFCRANEIIQKGNSYQLNLYDVYFEKKIPSNNNETYWGLFQYLPSDDKQIRFKLINAGINQQNF
jgi:kexin